MAPCSTQIKGKFEIGMEGTHLSWRADEVLVMVGNSNGAAEVILL